MFVKSVTQTVPGDCIIMKIYIYYKSSKKLFYFVIKSIIVVFIQNFIANKQTCTQW